MRNIWLIARREYIEKVWTKSFILSTLGLPALIAIAVLLPNKLGKMKTMGTRHVVVAASEAPLAESVKRYLLADPDKTGVKYDVETVANTSDDERKALTQRVNDGTLDGYVWLPDQAMAARKVTYSGREVSDFMDVNAVETAVTNARMEQQLAAHGLGAEVTENLLRKVTVDTVRINKGKESKTSTMEGLASSFGLVMLLYVVLLLYGIMVMRSVLEEKTSRIVEVLLSSVRAHELMAGKIVGVGAVGLTQVIVWMLMAGGLTLPAVAAAAQHIEISPASIAAFAIFFLLGFLLYSAIYASIGAMVNSEQEAQQLQILGFSPLIVAVSMMMLVVRQPNSTVAIWASMVPFLAPILMYLRISVQPPPLWQIGLCIALLVVTIWGVMVLAGRIYRVGILMYGKRPTLPELMKWLKYA
ncbi:MAG: ABC transporter permease [Terriglobales bacterium]|jgi:ABC-2 type transport system permease protein